MNEQELADLFSTQIDRILGGESAPAVAAEGDLPLLSLGQQLAQLNFQASPTAQAAFQNQLASWSGTPGGSLSTTGFTFTKILLLSVGAMAVIGAGLGLVVLISYIWTGAFSKPTTEDQPAVPAVTQPAPSHNPVVPSPVPATSTPVPATPTATQPPATSSLKDVLPAATNSVGDALPRPPSTVTPAVMVLPANGTPAPSPSSNGDNQESGTPQGDHDRGHGNDPDRYDEDNPGQSQGPSGAGSGSGKPSGGSSQGGGQGSSNNGSDHGDKGNKK